MQMLFVKGELNYRVVVVIAHVCIIIGLNAHNASY